MGDSAVVVRFGGDVSGLDSAVAVAKVQLAAFNAEVKNLAKEAAASGGAIDSGLMSKLRSATAQASSMKTEIKSLQGGFKNVGDAAKASGEAARHGGVGIGFYVRELRAMLDESLSGRTNQLAGSTARLFTTFATSNPEIAITAGLIAAVTGAIVYMAASARQASVETKSLANAADFSGVANISKEEVGKIRATIYSLKDTTSFWSGLWDWMAQISAEDARKINDALVTMHNGSKEVFSVLASDISDYAAATKTDLPKAADTLVKAFSDPLNQGENLVKLFPALTEEQRKFYEETIKGASITQAQSALQTILTQSLAKGVSARHADIEGLIREKQAYADSIGPLLAAVTGTNAKIGALKHEEAALESAERQQDKFTGALKSAIPTAAQFGQTLREALDKAGGSGSQIDELTRKLNALKGAMENVQGGAGSAGGGSSGSVGGWWTGDKQSQAIDYLMKNAGLSQMGASGLVARWAGVEAGGGPGSVNSSSGAFGIGQWLGDRKNGISGNTDFEAQLKHAVDELLGSESAAGNALRSAKTPQEAARGASMYERAEGYNAATGTDKFTNKTPVGQVYANKFGSADTENFKKGADAQAELKDQILAANQAKAGGTEIDKAALANLQAQLAGKHNELTEQQATVAGIEKQLALTSSVADKAKLQQQLDAARVALMDKQYAAQKAAAQIKVVEAEGNGDPEKVRAAKLSANQLDIDRLKPKGGAPETAQYRQAQQERISINQAADKEIQRNDASAEDASYQNALKGLDERRELIKEEVQDGKLSKIQALSQDLQIETQRAEVERNHFEKLKTIWDQGTQEYRSAQQKLTEVAADEAKRRQKTETDANKEILKDYQHAFESIGSTVSGDIMGMLEHTKKFSDLTRDVAKNLVSQFVNMGVKMVADQAAVVAKNVAEWAFGEQTKTGATAAGTAERTALSAAGAVSGMAAQAGAILRSIAASAAEAGAGVTGFLAPIMGPAAVGAGAATEAEVLAMGAVAAFDIGAAKIPYDMLSVVHKNELIMTASQGEAFRSVLNNASGHGPASAPPVNASANFHVSTMDSRSLTRFINSNQRALAKGMANLVKNGAHLGLKGLSPA